VDLTPLLGLPNLTLVRMDHIDAPKKQKDDVLKHCHNNQQRLAQETHQDDRLFD
jgi:hypothetical protein